ncbi:hypothetical protein QBC39DRAFT_351331 [Podospora conica]|nr:hypothetical protein QBC39DRAFT_351331 [Schizothecium conicum]
MQNYHGGNPNPSSYPHPTPPPLHPQPGVSPGPTPTAPPSTSTQQPQPQPQLQQNYQFQHHQYQQPLQYQPQPPSAQYQQQQQPPAQYQQPPVAYQQQPPVYQQQPLQQQHQFAPQTSHAGWNQQPPQGFAAPQPSPQSQFPPQQQPQQQPQYGASPQPPQPTGTPQQQQPGQFPQHQYGALSQSPQPVTTPQQSQPGHFQQQQLQQYGQVPQPPQPLTPQQPQPGQVPQQQQRQYGAPVQPVQFPGASQQQQQYGALPQHLQPATTPSPQQAPLGQLLQQHQYGVAAQSPQTMTAPQTSPQGQFLPQQQYGVLPQPPPSGSAPQQVPGQLPQQQQQYGTPQPQAPGYPVSYQNAPTAPTPYGQQPTTPIGQAGGLPGQAGGLPGQPAPYGYGGPTAHPPPIPLTKTSTGLKSRFGATVAGFQSKLGTYMAKVQTPPSSAYPGAPGAAQVGYGHTYGQQPQQSPNTYPPQPMQGAQAQQMQAVASYGQPPQPAQSPSGQPMAAPPPYGQHPQPPQTQPSPATVTSPQYGQQPQQSQQHAQPPSPYGQPLQPPQTAQRQPTFPAAPTGQPPIAAPMYGQPTQAPQGGGQSVFGTSSQGYQAGVGSPYIAGGAPAAQSAVPLYPPQQTGSTPVSAPAPWQPHQAPFQPATYGNASPSVPTPAPSSPSPGGTPAPGFPLTGTPRLGTPAMPTPVAHGQGLPQWTRHSSYDLSAQQQQTQSLASEQLPAQPADPASATSPPASGPGASQYGRVEDQQQTPDVSSLQPPAKPASPQSGAGEERQGPVQQTTTNEAAQSDASVPAQAQHGSPMPHPTQTFARKAVSPPSTEPPLQPPAQYGQPLTTPHPEGRPSHTLDSSVGAVPETQQSPPSDSWSVSALTSQIQGLLVADTPVSPDPAHAQTQHQPPPPSAQVPGLVAISSNPYPVNGETVVTDYFLHPMFTAPFSDTPKTRSCRGNSKIPESRTWFFHPTTHSFTICGFCYDTWIAPSKFGLEFASRNERGLHCHFHVPRVTRILWPQAVASGDMSLLVAYMVRRSTEVKFCGGTEGNPKSAGIKWFLPAVLDDMGNPCYCEACHEDLIVGGPFERRLMAGVKEQPAEEDWYCTSWNNGFTRMILKGLDWEQFIQRASTRFRLPVCGGVASMSTQTRWWTLRGMGPAPAVRVCETCYLDTFKDSRWEGIFEECGPAFGQAGACDWNPANNPNFNMAVATAILRRLGAEELRRILFTVVSKPKCFTQEPFQDGLYYNFRGTRLNEYGVCEACFEARMRPLGIGQFFTDSPQVIPGATHCSFNPLVPNSGFLAARFIEAVDTGVWAVYEDHARLMPNLPLCAGINAMQGGRWWGWPDCTICEYCFHTFAFGTKFAPEMPLQGITGAPDESRICGLFSVGQQKRYLDACQTNKLDEFLEFCRVRQVKWAELWPAIQRLQGQISSTYWAGMNLSIAGHGNKMSDHITFGTPTTEYISSSGNRYNSYSGVLGEQQEAQGDALMRQGAAPQAEQKRLLAIWAIWE